MRWTERPKGQSLSDYIIVIAIISASIISMNTYLRRAIQAKSVDILISSGFNEQYEEVKSNTSATTGKEAIRVLNSNSRSSINITGGKIISTGSSNADVELEAFP